MTAFTTREEQPLISVSFEILDSLTNEPGRCFSECNTKLVVSICALLPCSEKFLDLDPLDPLCDLVSKSGAPFDQLLLNHETEIARNLVVKKQLSTCQEN